MFSLIQFHGPTLAVCVALGAATAWWMFGGDRRKRKSGQTEQGRPEPAQREKGELKP